MRAQAVIIDALFFMLVCTSAAGILFWASSMYGEKSYTAYHYMYLNDYETSAISAVGKIAYQQDPSICVEGEPCNMRYWLDELGKYMVGEEIPDASHTRFKRLVQEWVKFCAQAPVPLVLEVYNEKPTKRGNMDSHLFFACPLSRDGTDPKVYEGQSMQTVTVLGSDIGAQGTDGTVLDFAYKRVYPSSTLCDDVPVNDPNGRPACHSDKTESDGHYLCSTGSGCDVYPEPPFFASNVQRKLCADLVCVMQTKVYY